MTLQAGRMAMLVAALASFLYADGGTLQVRQAAGPFVLSVFTAPAVLRAGNVDFSVLVQESGRLDPAPDADVEVRAESREGIIVSKAATHDNAQNKLLYAASLNLPQPGEWTFDVRVHQQQRVAKVSGKLFVDPSEPRFLAHWPQWVFVPVLVLLFILHQWLKSKQRVAA